jgi:hypothetical protein
VINVLSSHIQKYSELNDAFMAILGNLEESILIILDQKIEYANEKFQDTFCDPILEHFESQRSSSEQNEPPFNFRRRLGKIKTTSDKINGEKVLNLKIFRIHNWKNEKEKYEK